MKFKTVVLLFPLIAAFILPVAAPSQSAGGVEILLSKARSLEARGLDKLAADNWRKVLLVNPNQTEALAGLARNAKEMGETAKEDEYLGRLKKINPQDPEIEAVKTLRVFTTQERSRMAEAGRLAMQHKPDEAMKIYREVLGNEPPPLGKWAKPYFETEASSNGGREKAIAQLRRLSMQHPEQDAYRVWLASLLTYDPKTRMEGFRMFESIKDPGFAEQARADWRRALLWEKQNPQDLASIQAYLQRYPDPELQAAATALQAKQQQIANDNERQQGFKELKSKHLDAAGAQFTAVLHRSPNDANALVGLGYVRLDQKQFSEAYNLFDRAREIAPQRQDARDGYESAKFWLAVQSGTEAEQQHQPAAAALAFQNALTLRPYDTDALLGLANALVQEKNFSEAEATFQQVLSRDPNNVDALSGIGFLRLDEGKFNEAQKFLDRAHELAPSRNDIDRGDRNSKFWGIMQQAAASLKQDQTRAAIAEYQQAILIKPSDKDALQGLANAYVRAGDSRGAAKEYYKLLAAYPSDASNWLGLIRAQLGEQAPQAAISTAQRIPDNVKQELEKSSAYFSELALAYNSAHESARADQMLQQALQLAKASDSSDALSARLQIAADYMNQGRTAEAIEIYHDATIVHPDEAGPWEALVGAYTRANDFSDAIASVRRMPETAYEAAMKEPGFLNSVALLYSTRGQCSQAQSFLQRSLTLEKSAGRQPSESTQLQLAGVLLREHSYAQAQKLYHSVTASDPNSSQAWRGYLVSLHKQNADGTLVAEIPHIPPVVRKQLETDPSFLVLEGSAYSTADRNQDALPLLQQARSRYTAEHKEPPVNLDIQTAWTMLAISPDQPGLSELLHGARSHPRLNPQQRSAIEDLWSTWSVRRANQAFKTNPQLAFSILTNAEREYPDNRNIHIALASLYLKRNDKEKMLEDFQNWTMKSAQAADFRMAAGTALSAHKNDLADQYLRRGLIRFPHDPGLLHMLGKREIALGEYKQGENELRSALLALREQSADPPDSGSMIPPAPQQSSLDSSAMESGSGGALSSAESAPTCKTEQPGETASDAQIRPISFTFPVPQSQAADAPGASTGQLNSQATAQTQKEAEQMQEEVEAVDDRNTPVISFGGTGTGRVGDAGIDRLAIGDGRVRATYTISNRVKLAVEGGDVYAYSGTPDGTANLRFGTLPAYTVFGQQSARGFDGMAELSTKTFGLAVGTTPQGFPVHNLIGGIRFRPLNGPFVFTAVRESVKDSLLSYAGARDPGTGIRWGGVVANTATFSASSAPRSNAVYRSVGVYGTASYSFLQGLSVPDNWSASGNFGLYWQMVQGLTIGANAYAMHYDQNLGHFSFGQGGYFSPQQFYIASVPISWYARHPRFDYEIRFSGGLQYVQDDKSPIYPVLPGSASITQGNYSSDSSTTPNYDLLLRLGYRVAPHVYFDTFATANNARNYYDQSVGFSLKFMFDRIPTHTDVRVNSVPDWTGKQPFATQ